MKRPAALTCEQLIRSELRGKFQAIERYDSMLWKIRSGYVLILYGALSLLVGEKGLSLIFAEGNHRLAFVALLLVWGFSASAFLVDVGFLSAKLRVVKDSNALYNLAVDLATGNQEVRASDLKELLHNSGESLKTVDRAVRWGPCGGLCPCISAHRY